VRTRIVQLWTHLRTESCSGAICKRARREERVGKSDTGLQLQTPVLLTVTYKTQIATYLRFQEARHAPSCQDDRHKDVSIINATGSGSVHLRLEYQHSIRRRRGSLTSQRVIKATEASMSDCAHHYYQGRLHNFRTLDLATHHYMHSHRCFQQAS
jgi:hypothetical protein